MHFRLMTWSALAPPNEAHRKLLITSALMEEFSF